MKIIGIVAVKDKSRRFPLKNFYKIGGKELFMVNVSIIEELGYECIVATSSELARKICENNSVKYLWRGKNISDDEQPIFEVIKWAYQSLDKYDIIIVVLANTFKLCKEDIVRAINLLTRHNLNEVRSVDKEGKENGLIVLRSDYLLLGRGISAYLGTVTTEAKEIHYEDDIKG